MGREAQGTRLSAAGALLCSGGGIGDLLLTQVTVGYGEESRGAWSSLEFGLGQLCSGELGGDVGPVGSEDWGEFVG